MVRGIKPPSAMVPDFQPVPVAGSAQARPAEVDSLHRPSQTAAQLAFDLLFVRVVVVCQPHDHPPHNGHIAKVEDRRRDFLIDG